MLLLLLAFSFSESLTDSWIQGAMDIVLWYNITRSVDSEKKQNRKSRAKERAV